MRIRRQLSSILTAAAIAGVLLLAAMLAAARAQWLLGGSMARAQAISHEVSGLLVLTQEYALHGDARAAQHQVAAFAQQHRAAVSATADLRVLQGDIAARPPVDRFPTLAATAHETYWLVGCTDRVQRTFYDKRGARRRDSSAARDRSRCARTIGSSCSSPGC